MVDYTFALVTSLIFCLLRFIEAKYISKAELTMKSIVKDAVFSYLAALGGLYITNNIVSSEIVVGDNVKVFTGEPDF